MIITLDNIKSLEAIANNNDCRGCHCRLDNKHCLFYGNCTTSHGDRNRIMAKKYLKLHAIKEILSK